MLLSRHIPTNNSNCSNVFLHMALYCGNVHLFFKGQGSTFKLSYFGYFKVASRTPCLNGFYSSLLDHIFKYTKISNIDILQDTQLALLWIPWITIFLLTTEFKKFPSFSKFYEKEWLRSVSFISVSHQKTYQI